MARTDISVSLTELEPFRTLVDFARAVEEHADEVCDIALRGLVHEPYDDLRKHYHH